MLIIFSAPQSAPKPLSVTTKSASFSATLSATMELLPWAMLANGPACTITGVFSSVWIRLGMSASFSRTAMAPAAFRSSAVTGCPSSVVPTTMGPGRAGQGQDGHDLAGDADVDPGLPRPAVLLGAQADDNVSQGAVADVHDARPGDGVGVDLQFIAVQ